MNNTLALLDRLAPAVRDAFIASINSFNRTIDINLLERAIASGDISKVMEILQVPREYFAPLNRALTVAYQTGGDVAMLGFIKSAKRQGVKIVARFDDSNPRAVRWLTEKSASKIYEAIKLGDQTLPRLVGEAISRAAEGKATPRTIALDLAGRVNPATGSRSGGLVGLTPSQGQWVTNAREELSSGHPSQLNRYLGRKARDKRYDRAIKKAIRDGKPVSAADINGATQSYSNRLLRRRGETIARTELLESLHEAQSEGLRQLRDKGDVKDEHVTKEWDAANDLDTRPTHADMDNEKVVGIDTPFLMSSLQQLRFPGDKSLGADAAETANCRCVSRIDIDFLAGLE